MDLPPCRIVTWSDIDRWADSIALQIERADRSPETIVGLTRGGWIPARLLADRLGVKHLAAVRAQHWGVTATRNGSAEITEGLSRPLTDRKVLVVDDITDTGQSLRLAIDHVQESHPALVESATFLHIERSTYRPTYWAEVVPKETWTWFIFPWNYWEDVGNLARKALPDGHDEYGVRRLLKELSGINIEERDIRSALARTAPK